GAKLDRGRRFKLLLAGTRVPIPRELRPVLAAFFLALMGLVLSLACINLANILIARTANRRKELAIRIAVGASRFRLLRHIIAEGIALSLLGGLAGLGGGVRAGAVGRRFSPPAVVPPRVDVSPARRAGRLSL